VLSQHIRIPLAKLAQQARGALDVGEQKRDGAAREPAHGAHDRGRPTPCQPPTAVRSPMPATRPLVVSRLPSGSPERSRGTTSLSDSATHLRAFDTAAIHEAFCFVFIELT
jgi:hypothetical protein